MGKSELQKASDRPTSYVRRYPNPRPKAVDLFCGVGGMSLGFEQAGFDIVLGVESDGHHVAAHHRNFPYAKTVCTSVTDITAHKLDELLAEHRDQIDVVFGGPPCQGFSNMGFRDVADPRNTLVDEFARIVQLISPKAFVMENVPGMASGSTRTTLDRVVADLENAGYRITEPIRTLTASDFGVPQGRSRLFLLGIRADIGGELAYPTGPRPGQPLRPTVWEAIADLPTVEDYPELLTQDAVPYDTLPKSEYARVARSDLQDPSDLVRPRRWDHHQCTGCMRTRHQPRSIALYNSTPPGRVVPGHKLPRLHPDGIAPTLRAGSDSSRGSYTAPRPIHPFLARCITAREAARLHGYPDWFSFYPTKWHAYKQIGNSVCPPVARAIGYEVRKSIEKGARYRSKPPRPIQLTSRFDLPEGRPRQKRRIPQVREYPKVVTYLFNHLYDPEQGLVKDGRFSASDVAEAIENTKANLPATRPDTFLDELTRSRSVKQLLEKPLSLGYSIRPLAGASFIGEFVPADEPGVIHEKDELAVKARDLSRALQIHLPYRLLESVSGHIDTLLNTPEVRRRVWPRSISVGVNDDVLISSIVDAVELRVHYNRSSSPSYLLIGNSNNIPPKSRIARTALRMGIDDIVVVAPVTKHHVLVSRFRHCQQYPQERRRFVFSLNGQ